MMMKCAPVCLVALALLGSLCDAQWHGAAGKPSKQSYQRPRPPVRQEPSKQVPQEPQQSKQTFEKPLTWTYPADPTPEPQPEVPFEQRHPVAATTVSVECRERDVHVEVKKDIFGNGQLVNPADLTLGTCGPVAEDNVNQAWIFEAELHDCDSTLIMTEESLIYGFLVNYSPQPLGLPVVRNAAVAVIVECHYPRKHNVSSLPLDPLWIPFSAVKVSEEFLYFTLRLMTDDWQYERPSYQYYLGDRINFEATVKQSFHVPLRVYVDSCVATLSPEATSNPKYTFIENYGCLVDAKITGSSSSFMRRTAENKLQFQLEAFRFQGAESGLLYITCHLKASSTAYNIDEQHRACSFGTGWTEASGYDAACGSCESGSYGSAGAGSSFGGTSGSHGGSSSLSTLGNRGGSSSLSTLGNRGGSSSLSTLGNRGGSSSLSTPGRKIRDVSQSEILEWEGDVTLGPIRIGEKVMKVIT